MKTVLRFSILLIVCYLEIVEIKNMSAASKATKTRKFRLSPNESNRLASLQLAIAQFVVTYVPRETIYTTRKGGYSQRHTRRNPYNISWKRPTKSTIRLLYTKLNKSYPTHLDRRKMIYRHLVNIFSNFDEEKKKFLTEINKKKPKKNPCYSEAISSFTNHCFYDYYYLFTGMKYIRNLLNQACWAEWLTTRKIIRVIEGCCGERFRFETFPNLF